MSTEVDQASAQEQIAPASTSSDAPEPPKAPEEAQGVTPTEDTPAETKAAIAGEAAQADDPISSTLPVGTAAAGDKQEDIAPKANQEALAEPAKTDEPIKDIAPADSTASGEKLDDIVPKQDAPTMTGALGDAPASSDNAAAPADDAVQDSATALGKPVEESPATKTNGAAEKDTDMTDAAPAAPEEAVNTADAVPGEKRKAEESAPTNGEAKKAKPDTNGSSVASTNGKGEAKKPGRPAKKEKKVVEKAKEVVGRTLRKTRSQGPVDQ